MWSGSDADVIQDIRDLKALGVRSCDFGFPGTTPEEVLGEHEALPRCRDGEGLMRPDDRSAAGREGLNQPAGKETS